MKPVVALVGRPNVGKSTLFNRITRTRDALVDDFPGVTRDRKYGEATWNETDFTLIDTGGFLGTDDDKFAGEIKFQVKQAIEISDIVVLVLDGKNGISPYDNELVELVRSIPTPVFYIVNKIDSYELEKNLYEFYGLGIENMFPVSGEHKYGMSDFLDELIRTFPQIEYEESDDLINIAVVGRPNVGKSSLINKITGEKRVVVSNVAGTTRDSIDTICDINNKSYRLIDTAGIRRKGKVSQKIEKFSIIKSLKSLDRCDVALILIDSSEGITDQDITIAGYAYERGCGCIFVLNKWDAVDKKKYKQKDFFAGIEHKAKFLSFAPVITVSALTGLRVPKIFNLVDSVYKQYCMRINTGQLNKIIQFATERTEPSLHKGKRIKFYYSTQVAIKPPTFVCFVNYPKAVHFSYQRYMLNQLRDSVGLDEVPVRLLFKLRTGKMDFEKLSDDNKNKRNFNAKDKFSKNKMLKKRERKIQSDRKKKRESKDL